MSLITHLLINQKHLVYIYSRLGHGNLCTIDSEYLSFIMFLVHERIFQLVIRRLKGKGTGAPSYIRESMGWEGIMTIEIVGLKSKESQLLKFER